MCGIVGYIGHRDAYPVIIKGLHRLEYRGYDSAGIVLYDGKDLKLSKTKGKVSDLEAKAESEKTTIGKIGMGHTRWATHGVPNDVNSHPHFSNSGKLVIIHNGILLYDGVNPIGEIPFVSLWLGINPNGWINLWISQMLLGIQELYDLVYNWYSDFLKRHYNPNFRYQIP